MGRRVSKRAALAVSFRPVLIPATALDPQQGGERIDCGARIGMRVEPASSLGADAAPLPHQQGAAEQIGPNRHAIVPPLVQLRPDAHKRGGFREQRLLNRRRRGRAGEAQTLFRWDARPVGTGHLTPHAGFERSQAKMAARLGISRHVAAHSSQPWHRADGILGRSSRRSANIAGIAGAAGLAVWLDGALARRVGGHAARPGDDRRGWICKAV